jgi:hypothetical protein
MVSQRRLPLTFDSFIKNLHCPNKSFDFVCYLHFIAAMLSHESS